MKNASVKFRYDLLRRKWLEGHSSHQNFGSAVKVGFDEFRHDLRTTRWRRGLYLHSILVWFGGLIATAVIINLQTQFWGNSELSCKPDDSFDTKPSIYRGSGDSYNYWDITGFFQITLGMGHLDFTSVKVIDVLWDVIIGRGGQALLAFISWQVFAQYISACMRVAPVSYQTFYTIFMQKDASILGIWDLTRDFCFRLPLSSRAAMVFMVTTMIFILAFPTMAGAMTGYSNNVSGFVQDDLGDESNLISFSKYRGCQYVIWDASRIDLEEPFFGYFSGYLAGVNGYILTYGLEGNNKTNSTFPVQPFYGERYNLPSPSLNISVPGYRPGSSFYEADNVWFLDNQVYNSSYMEAHGKCQNSPDYKWGFSFIQLNLMIYLLLLWTTGITLMWLNAKISLRNYDQEDVPGRFKAVFELADAMEEEISTQKQNPRDIPEKELEKTIEKDLKGGRVAYAYPGSKNQLPNRSVARDTIRKWVINEKWWLPGFVPALIYLCLVVAKGTDCFVDIGSIVHFLSAIGLFSGLWFSLQIGTTTKSRWLIILLLSVPFLLPVTIIPLIVLHYRQKRRTGKMQEVPTSNELLPTTK